MIREASIAGNTSARQGLRRWLSTRIRAVRLSRRVRLRHTLRAARKCERAIARDVLSQPSAAPRLWQRYLLVPLVTLVRGSRAGLVWLRAVVLPAPAPVLNVDPAQFLIIGHRGAGAS